MSVQAQILNVLRKRQRELGASYLFIRHNVGVVEYIAHAVAVMTRVASRRAARGDALVTRGGAAKSAALTFGRAAPFVAGIQRENVKDAATSWDTCAVLVPQTFGRSRQSLCRPHPPTLCDAPSVPRHASIRDVANALEVYPEPVEFGSSVTIPLRVFADRPCPVHKAGMWLARRFGLRSTFSEFSQEIPCSEKHLWRERLLRRSERPR